MTTPCAWDQLLGQRRAVAMLRKAVETGTVSHAYLFAGPPGVGKKKGARALACALLCADGGCGACGACSRVRAGVHPDFHLLTPGGASGYLVDQVRSVTSDVALTPVEGPVKVYVFESADRLGTAPANALLKTLEEPPDDVTFILLADDVQAVADTIVSRCQVIRFAHVPEPVALANVIERSMAAEEDARAALVAAGWVPGRAVDYLRTPARREARSQLLHVLDRLSVMDAFDVLDSVSSLLATAQVPLGELKVEHEAERSETAELTGRGASGVLRALDERHKRELTAREREGVAEIFNVAESWLRDCLAISQGAADLVLNRDVADAMEPVGAIITHSAALRAIDAVSRARSRVTANVSPQLALEAMLLDIQEVLKCPR
jgi:DNA polymerase-3 subunit delta'